VADAAPSPFITKLRQAWQSSGSLVCVGLDPDEDRLPTCLRGDPTPFFSFNRALIDAVAPHCAAFKPQFAHYAAAGRLAELQQTMAYIRRHHPYHLLILDSKRGDIGNTASHYARESFEHYAADAVTVNPYLGGDSLEPFTRWADRGVIVLCRTSNPGSGELQSLVCDDRPLYLHVATRAAGDWNRNGNLALVVGATYPRELAAVRSIVGDMPLLVPGIGAQGGDLAATLSAGLTASGDGLLINSSRAIIHASAGDDFAAAAGRAAADLTTAINALRPRAGR
jgi:orotidine-5'-phosphate decarboxylase